MSSPLPVARSRRAVPVRIALFGGAFDPIHLGHLRLAEAALEFCRLDRVVFLPSGCPPHKTVCASAHHRLAMVRLAIQGNPRFSVSDWEIRAGRVVYTAETLAHFRRCWPRARLFFVVGTDALAAIDSWKTGRAILDQCPFLAVERPGFPWRALPAGVRRKVRRVPSPLWPYASHEIRGRVRASKPIAYDVPERVAAYIRRHRLYGAP